MDGGFISINILFELFIHIDLSFGSTDFTSKVLNKYSLHGHVNFGVDVNYIDSRIVRFPRTTNVV